MLNKERRTHMPEMRLRKSVFQTKNIDTAIRRAEKHLDEWVEKHGYFENMTEDYRRKLEDVYFRPFIGENTMKAYKNARKITNFSNRY